MLSRFLSLLSLLLALVPTLALAVSSPPPPNDPTALSVQAVTCIPTLKHAALVKQTADAVSFAPGAALPTGELHVFCPVHGHGEVLWNKMRVLFLDPDRYWSQAGVRVTLYRKTGAAPPEALALFISNVHSCHPNDGPAWRSVDERILQPFFDFGRSTYWLDILLTRVSPFVVSPRIGTIWLFNNGGPW